MSEYPPSGMFRRGRSRSRDDRFSGQNVPVFPVLPSHTSQVRVQMIKQGNVPQFGQLAPGAVPEMAPAIPQPSTPAPMMAAVNRAMERHKRARSCDRMSVQQQRAQPSDSQITLTDRSRRSRSRCNEEVVDVKKSAPVPLGSARRTSRKRRHDGIEPFMNELHVPQQLSAGVAGFLTYQKPTDDCPFVPNIFNNKFVTDNEEGFTSIACFVEELKEYVRATRD